MKKAAAGADWTPTVVHVSPTYFSPESVIGGGERYAEDLSRAMSERVPVRFVSFGKRSLRERSGERYERVILRNWTGNKTAPFSPKLWQELSGAQAVHCYQLNTLSTFLAVTIARLRNIPVFVSDLGGGGWTPGYQIDIGRWLDGHLPISKYAASLVPRGHKSAAVIFGGVNLEKFRARDVLRHDGGILFLGRILPHKGIHFLIEGLPRDCFLKIIGPIADIEYLNHLKELAKGRNVDFLHGLSDIQVSAELARAAVLVHPTPVDQDGNAGVNELLGLAVLEAMACNCPVVVTDAASLPELIEEGSSGLIVPPNNPAAIHDAVHRIMTDPALWKELAIGARNRVDAQFTWTRTVSRCLEAYGLTENTRPG